MIYPIVAFGNPILKKEAEEIEEGSNLDSLIKNMYATMDFAHGVGLAAPQINQGIRLFVMDSSLMLDEDDDEKGIRKVFINPIILDEYGDDYSFEEGCLSIPEVRAEIIRPESSFVLSGIRSTVIEKINGKIFANPSPTINIPTNAVVLSPNSSIKIPATSPTKNSTIIEKELKIILPKKYWGNYTNLIIGLGRDKCIKNPKCEECPIKELCNYTKNNNL
jgi:hypothetical protein